MTLLAVKTYKQETKNKHCIYTGNASCVLVIQVGTDKELVVNSLCWNLVAVFFF